MPSRASKNIAYLNMGKPQFSSNPMVNEFKKGIASVKNKFAKLAITDKPFDISGIYK